MKTWLITECSSGFGRNLAETLLSEGEQVIVTARKPKTIQHFAKNYPLTALCLIVRHSMRRSRKSVLHFSDHVRHGHAQSVRTGGEMGVRGGPFHPNAVSRQSPIANPRTHFRTRDRQPENVGFVPVHRQSRLSYSFNSCR